MSERLLFFGLPTSGKSSCWLSIARMCQRMKRDVRFYVLDGDNRIGDQGDDVADIMSVRVPRAGPAECWEDYKGALDLWLPRVRPHDFLVVDMMDRPWEAVVLWYVKKVLKVDLDDFQMKYQQKELGNKSIKGDPLFEYYKSINAQYFSWQNQFLPNNPCHVICCASARAVIKAEDKAGFKDGVDIEGMFGGRGWKPGGQKGVPHHFNSIFLVEQNKPGVHTLTTITERKRSRQPDMGFEWFDSTPISNFASQYLFKTGWRPGL